MGLRFENPIYIPPKARAWLLENFVIGAKNYWFTFFADASTALVLISADLFWLQSSALSVVLSVIGGLFLWGFSEYAFHRWIYHHPDSIFGDGHRMHHETPVALLAMPWFMTTLAVTAVWWLGARVANIPNFSSVLAGWLAGFVWYSIVHHVQHHNPWRNAWMRRLNAFHRIHHHFPNTNYGVTMMMWDTVFGTRFRPPVRGKRKRNDLTDSPIEPSVSRLTEVGTPS